MYRIRRARPFTAGRGRPIQLAPPPAVANLAKPGHASSGRAVPCRPLPFRKTQPRRRPCAAPWAQPTQARPPRCPRRPLGSNPGPPPEAARRIAAKGELDALLTTELGLVRLRRLATEFWPRSAANAFGRRRPVHDVDTPTCWAWCAARLAHLRARSSH